MSFFFQSVLIIFYPFIHEVIDHLNNIVYKDLKVERIIFKYGLLEIFSSLAISDDVPLFIIQVGAFRVATEQIFVE